FSAGLSEISDLTTGIIPSIAINLRAQSLNNLENIRHRAPERYQRSLPITREGVRCRDAVSLLDAPGGITAAVRVDWLDDSGELANWLAVERKILIAPGSAFQMPKWIRINMANEPDWLHRALKALGDGLDGYRAARGL